MDEKEKKQEAPQTEFIGPRMGGVKIPMMVPHLIPGITPDNKILQSSTKKKFTKRQIIWGIVIFAVVPLALVFGLFAYSVLSK